MKRDGDAGTAPEPGWYENRPSRGWRGLDAAELWRYRELLWFFASRDLRVRYKQAALGGAWAVLRPLVGAIAFTVVFRRLADVPSDGIPYVVFAYLSFAAWSCVSAGVASATSSLVANASLVTKVYFPRIVAPTAAVLPGLVDFAASCVVLAALMAFHGVVPGPELLAAPLFVSLLPVVALAFGLWLVTLHVRYRDANHLTALLLQTWLFVSPVAYPMSMVEGTARHLYALNPAAGVLTGLRWSVLGGPWPGWSLAISLATTLLLLAGGSLYFLRAERRFADVI